MAKFGVYYGLCPLIDHRSLLGIAKDEENGMVVVTLGKNIAIKYKLSDQKQIHSWRTKEKFTSPIVYDHEQSKYAAVFNHTFIRCWSGNEEFIDKVKKHKFKTTIHTIISCDGANFVVFQNGAVNRLKDAVENRKELHVTPVFEGGATILDVLTAHLNNVVYVGLVVQSQDQICLYWSTFQQSAQSDWVKIEVSNPGFVLSGYTFHKVQNSVNFLCLWSDGRICATELSSNSPSTKSELLATVDSFVCKDYVAIVSLDQNYIAMYGCNQNEEGALLTIYNVQFKVTQSKQHFKMFTKGAKLWTVDDNLFLPVGQNLAVVPFHLDTEQLAALVGSHKLANLDPDICIFNQVETRLWNATHDKNESETLPEGLKDDLEDFVSQGTPENEIFEEVMARYVEKKNVDGLLLCLDRFTDISEKCLSTLLKFALNAKKTKLLDAILTKSFSDMSILPHLRHDLNMEDVVVLIKYICAILTDVSHGFRQKSRSESDHRLINWGCVLLDSNYQKFLQSKDEIVKETITLFNSIVMEEVVCLEDLQEVIPLLKEITTGKNVHKKGCVSNSFYSVEEAGFYEK